MKFFPWVVFIVLADIPAALIGGWLLWRNRGKTSISDNIVAILLLCLGIQGLFGLMANSYRPEKVIYSIPFVLLFSTGALFRAGGIWYTVLYLTGRRVRP